MNKLNIILISSICCCLIAGCSSNTYKDNNDVRTSFYTDSNTVKYEYKNNEKLRADIDEEASKFKEEHTIENHEHENYINELTISNESNTELNINFTINEYGDIIYGNKVFVSLKSSIDSTETQVDKNSLITFLIKYTNFDSDIVYTNYELASTCGEDCSISFEEGISDVDNYSKIKDKYNEEVKWCINLVDGNDINNRYTIWGATQYVLLEGADSPVNISVAELNSINNSSSTNINTVDISNIHSISENNTMAE